MVAFTPRYHVTYRLGIQAYERTSELVTVPEGTIKGEDIQLAMKELDQWREDEDNLGIYAIDWIDTTGLVPNEETAIKIIDLLRDQYNQRLSFFKRPYDAEGGFVYVRNTLTARSVTPQQEISARKSLMDLLECSDEAISSMIIDYNQDPFPARISFNNKVPWHRMPL